MRNQTTLLETLNFGDKMLNYRHVQNQRKIIQISKFAIFHKSFAIIIRFSNASRPT